MTARKLQQEIDRLFKKVNEGIDEFDYIYDKLYDSDNQAQKDKLEVDLKKNIKKLQRNREQIKNWIASSEVKDKKACSEYRRKIEREMERFKEVEKVMKTKAFSNEALASGGAPTLDPTQKEKKKRSEYLETQLEELQRQAEGIEAEVDRVYLSMKKHRADAAKQQELDELDERLKQHKFHMTMLENLMRMLMNDKLEFELVDQLRDDIDYYVESNEDPEFVDSGNFYEDVLDEAQMAAVNGSANDDTANDSQESTPAPTPTPTSDRRSRKDEADLPELEKSKRSSRLSSISRVSSHSARVAAVAPSRSGSDHGSAQTFAAQLHGQHSPKSRSSTIAASTASIFTGGLKPATPVGTPKLKYATVASASLHSAPHSKEASREVPKEDRPKSVLSGETPTKPRAKEPETGTSTSSNATVVVPPPSSSTLTSESSIAAATAFKSSLSFLDVSNYTNLPEGFDKYVGALETVKDRLVEFEDHAAGTTVHPPYRLKLPSLESIFPQLESSLLNCPDSFDADAPKCYVPANQLVTQTCFPQEPAAEIMGSPSLLKHLDLGTLLYCFYYQRQRYESSFTNVHNLEPSRDDEYLQYIAAKELHSRGWKFSTQSQTWFHQDDAEGWRYFDYKNTWAERAGDLEFNESREEKAFF